MLTAESISTLPKLSPRLHTYVEEHDSASNRQRRRRDVPASRTDSRAPAALCVLASAAATKQNIVNTPRSCTNGTTQESVLSVYSPILFLGVRY